MLKNITDTGSIGVIKDLSKHELPDNAWTDSLNIRFLDGYASQSFGYSEIYASPSAAPQHISALNIAAEPYWIYTTAAKVFAVAAPSGVITHTELTPATPLTGVANKWSSTMLSGVPIINTFGGSHYPHAWDMNLANDFVALANWPANHYCKSIRAFKNYLIALNVTKTATNYPYLVMWSHKAEPGAVPSSWTPAATNDAGEFDIAEGHDFIVDGLQLRDTFIVYKQYSTWSMSWVGGVTVFARRHLFNHGAMGLNCVCEFDGQHFVVTRDDVIIHDGNTAISVLDKQTRRFFFDDIDSDGQDKVFVVKNPYMNEILVCYPEIGSTVCNKAMVWNHKDRTVSFRSMPNVNHAAFGHVSQDLGGSWASDGDSWDSDLTLWDKGDFIPGKSSVILASSASKLYLMDGASSADGTLETAYLERQGLSFGAPEQIKLIKGIRPRIQGNAGETVTIKIGGSDDPYIDPVYTVNMSHTIGETISNDCFVSGRYIAIRFESGTAYQWRLDSYQIDLQTNGAW
jgi:hypothetical protein